MEKVKVPLWLAVTLRKSNKCRIQTPEWMSVGIYPATLLFHSFMICSFILNWNSCNYFVDNLQRVLENDRKVEIESSPSLSNLPRHYIEISRVLLEKYAHFEFP